MTEEELYASTRAWWALDPNRIAREGVKHAVAVFEGVTRGLFTIEGWLPQRGDGDRAFTGKTVRDGQLWDEVVGPIGHRVSFTKGARSPITYWPRERS